MFNFTQLQRFRQNRDLQAFDKAKAAATNPIDSDSDSDSDSDDEPLQTENRNQLNKMPVSSRLSSQR